MFVHVFRCRILQIDYIASGKTSVTAPNYIIFHMFSVTATIYLRYHFTSKHTSQQITLVYKFYKSVCRLNPWGINLFFPLTLCFIYNHFYLFLSRQWTSQIYSDLVPSDFTNFLIIAKSSLEIGLGTGNTCFILHGHASNAVCSSLIGTSQSD